MACVWGVSLQPSFNIYILTYFMVFATVTADNNNTDAGCAVVHYENSCVTEWVSGFYLWEHLGQRRILLT